MLNFFKHLVDPCSLVGCPLFSFLSFFFALFPFFPLLVTSLLCFCHVHLPVKYSCKEWLITVHWGTICWILTEIGWWNVRAVLIWVCNRRTYLRCCWLLKWLVELLRCLMQVCLLVYWWNWWWMLLMLALKVCLSRWIVDHQGGSQCAHCGLAMVSELLRRTVMRVSWNLWIIVNTCAFSKVASGGCLGLMSCWTITGVVVASTGKTLVVCLKTEADLEPSSMQVLCFLLDFLLLFSHLSSWLLLLCFLVGHFAGMWPRVLR